MSDWKWILPVGQRFKHLFPVDDRDGKSACGRLSYVIPAEDQQRPAHFCAGCQETTHGLEDAQ